MVSSSSNKINKNDIFEYLLSESIENVINSFHANPDKILTENLRKSLFFNHVSNSLKLYRSNHDCIYLNCTKKSIKNSHTISKKLFLATIEENGHVLRPKFDTNTNSFILDKIGINLASTFPGFCTNHEKLFQDFEEKDQFNTPEHFNLQLYRTICREYFIKKYQQRIYSQLLISYKEFRNNALLEKYRKDNFIKFLESKGLQFKGLKYSMPDTFEKLITKELNYLNKEIDIMHVYYQKGTDLLEGKDDFWGKAYSLDIQIPVCLSGRANFKVNDNGKEKNIIVFINVLPQKINTTINICGLNKDEDYIKLYLNSALTDGISFLTMIETWMVRGTDHWFIKPSIWQKISRKSQKTILQDFRDLSYNIGTPYLITIFQDLKAMLTMSN